MYLKTNQAARIMLYAACAVAVLLLLSTAASAQTTDVFSVTYFDNANTFATATAPAAPVALVHVLNPGNGAVCADIYVFGADQELSECCSCPITPNGLLTFDVNTATVNPGDGNPPRVTGSIDIIADSSTTCTDATAAAPTPTPDLRAWATHVNKDSVAGGFDVTEDEALDTPLSSGELSELGSRCGFFLANSSGKGRCDRRFPADTSGGICGEFVGATGGAKVGAPVTH